MPSFADDLYAIGAGSQLVGVSVVHRRSAQAKGSAARRRLRPASMPKRSSRFGPTSSIGIPRKRGCVDPLRRAGIHVVLLPDDAFDRDLREPMRDRRANGSQARSGRGRSRGCSARDRELHARTRAFVAPSAAFSSCSAAVPIWTAGVDLVHRDARSRLAGGRTRQPICTRAYGQYSAEALVRAQPDLLVADPATHLDAALDREPWRSLRAVRLHRVYIVDPDDHRAARTDYNEGIRWLVDRLDAAAATVTPMRTRARRRRRNAGLARHARTRTGGVRSARRSRRSADPRAHRAAARRRRSGDAGRQRQSARNRRAAEELDADLLLVLNDLRPRQRKNLEKIVPLPIVDRTMLILDVFARHARSREGKLQVELAQLRYRQSNLIGVGADLSRLGGGIGTRGPGETKLEVDRRRIDERISVLNRQLADVRRQRAVRRSAPRREPLVALVGYTNVGKSSLLNALARSDAFVADQPFATLDPTMRRVYLAPGAYVRVADTVGFITDLPKDLVNAFRATLEELREADLLAARSRREQSPLAAPARAVEAILHELELDRTPRFTVFNKCDLRRRKRSATAGALCVSATTRAGLDALRAAVVDTPARKP